MSFYLMLVSTVFSFSQSAFGDSDSSFLDTATAISSVVDQLKPGDSYMVLSEEPSNKEAPKILLVGAEWSAGPERFSNFSAGGWTSINGMARLGFGRQYKDYVFLGATGIPLFWYVGRSIFKFFAAEHIPYAHRYADPYDEAIRLFIAPFIPSVLPTLADLAAGESWDMSHPIFYLLPSHHRSKAEINQALKLFGTRAQVEGSVVLIVRRPLLKSIARRLIKRNKLKIVTLLTKKV